MAYLSQKERVYDIKLTPTGTRLLQHGAFKPAYYCFFDDGVIYDYSYAGVMNEEQNQIETRIQDAPQLETVAAKFSIEEDINKVTKGDFYIAEFDIFQSIGLGGSFGLAADPTLFPLFLGALDPSQLFSGPVTFAEAIVDVIGSYDGLFGVPSLVQNKRNRFYSMNGPLGTMDFSANNVYPKWNIDFLKAPITGSYSAVEAFGEKAYELECDLQYEIHVKEAALPEAVEADYEEEDILDSMPLEMVDTSLEDLNVSPITLDGSYLIVQDDYLFIKVAEENTRFLNENFDIEMYKINSNGDEERLYFDNENINLKDLFSSKHMDAYGDPTMESLDPFGVGFNFSSSPVDQYVRNFVKYFFDILVDEEIPDEIYCKALKEDKLEQTYTDQSLFDCSKVQVPVSMDPYDLPDEKTELCDGTEE